MNKNYVKLGCVLSTAAIMLSLAACGNTTPPSSKPETPPPSSQSGPDIQETQLTPLEQLAKELTAIPEEYTPEQAAQDNFLVMAQGKTQPSLELLDSFLKDVEEKQNSVLKLVQYTTEGDPVLTGVAFDGKSFVGLQDNTRDAFAAEENRKQTEFAFKALKTFESEGKLYVYLLEDDSVTLEQLRGDAAEPVDAFLLFAAEK